MDSDKAVDADKRKEDILISLNEGLPADQAWEGMLEGLDANLNGSRPLAVMDSQKNGPHGVSKDGSSEAQ